MGQLATIDNKYVGRIDMSSGCHIGVIGTNFKTSSIDHREKLKKIITYEYLKKFKEENIARFSAIQEVAVLSTCNRLEIYFVTKNLLLSEDIISEIFDNGIISALSSMEQEIDKYVYSDQLAVEHINYVASGLDSLIIGEAQILTQIKQTLTLYQSKKMSGPIISKLFLKACATGKGIREQFPLLTNGFKNSVSLSIANFISQRFQERSNPNILLIGSGKMAKLAIASFDQLKLGRIMVASRRNAPEGIIVDLIVPLSEIPSVLSKEHIDVVVAATTSEDYVITPTILEPFSKKNRELLIVDISIPRTVDPAIPGAYPNIELINLDDLKKQFLSLPELVKSSDRADELLTIQKTIQSKSKKFMTWLEEVSVITPVMSSLRRKAEGIRIEEYGNVLARLDLTQPQQEVIGKMSERIIRRFLHEPAHRLKEASRDGDIEKSKEYVGLLKSLFSLDNENPQQLDGQLSTD
jgi:glutamyl-tRNA reductase